MHRPSPVELIKGMLSRLSCFAGLGGMIADGMRRIEEGQHAIAHNLQIEKCHSRFSKAV